MVIDSPISSVTRVAHRRMATSSCRGHVDELATEPFLLLHREHGTGSRRSWNGCDRRTRFVVIWKHFCLILLRAPWYGLTLWCALGLLLRGRNTSPSGIVIVTVPCWYARTCTSSEYLRPRRSQEFIKGDEPGGSGERKSPAGSRSSIFTILCLFFILHIVTRWDGPVENEP